VTRKIRSTVKLNYLIGNQIRDLPSCSIVSQPTTLQRVPELCQLRSEEIDVGSATRRSLCNKYHFT
jgi:hypothetical protein